jgi:hypothetical protein
MNFAYQYRWKKSLLFSRLRNGWLSSERMPG